MKKILLFLSLITGTTYAQDFQKQLNRQVTGFIENKGQLCDQNKQLRPEISFYGSAGDLNYYLKNNGISYQLVHNTYAAEQSKKRKSHKNIPLQRLISSQIQRIDVNLMGANTKVTMAPLNAQSNYTNYFLPQCPKGVGSVKNYLNINCTNVYNGIDMRYFYNADGTIEYDFIVNPGADYSVIKLDIAGATSVQPINDGGVVISTSLGNIIQGKPIVLQAGKDIDAHWVINNNVLSYAIGAYDHTQPLIIDPVVLSYGTYFGGGGCVASSGRLDGSGNLYIAGYSSSVINIATTGAYQATITGASDAFVAKFDPATTLSWCTYYGADSIDGASSCGLDSAGNIYIAGQTYSPTGMATAGAHQMNCDSCRSLINGAADAFVSKFDNSGMLQWSTYYGGSGDEEASASAVDKSGNVYIVGTTASASGIATPGAYMETPTFDGSFISKFNASGVLQWGTYYGGVIDTDLTWLWGCSLDGAGDLFVTGPTNIPTAMATSGAYQSTRWPSNQKSVLSKFSSSGSRLWSTYFGGASPVDSNSYTYSTGCTNDASGNVFITGLSTATTGIASPGAHQPYVAGSEDAFLAKFDGSGTYQWGTYYGGNYADEGAACATDAVGNVCMTGSTSSTSGIATTGAYQATCDSCDTSYYGDAFVAMFEPSGSLLWGTYYGGSGSEEPLGCSIKSGSGTVYVIGATSSLTGIATAGAATTSCDSCSSGSATFIAEFNYLTTDVDNVSAAADNIVLFPNPTHDEFTITGVKPASIKVFNMLGAEEITITGGNKMSLKTLAGGVYLVQLRDDNGITIKNIRVVKL